VSDTKQISRRQLIEDARLTAMEGRWDDALTINEQIIERTPRDAAAFNRLGKAQVELGNPQLAIEAYTSSLKIDPANMIARRNLQRLEQLRGHGNGTEARQKRLTPRTNVFIQEVGKTWVDELVNPAPTDVLADVASGEALELKVKSGRLLVNRGDGVTLGEIDPRTAERVIQLMKGGNTYEIYALGQSSAGLRIILRENYRHPSQADRVSFPRQISQAGKYLRERDLLRQRDEADFYFSDEEEEDTDSDTDSDATDSQEDEESDLGSEQVDFADDADESEQEEEDVDEDDEEENET
jgi:tetratricopeptide (TPR) repeat protein